MTFMLRRVINCRRYYYLLLLLKERFIFLKHFSGYVSIIRFAHYINYAQLLSSLHTVLILT